MVPDIVNGGGIDAFDRAPGGTDPRAVGASHEAPVRERGGGRGARGGSAGSCVDSPRGGVRRGPVIEGGSGGGGSVRVIRGGGVGGGKGPTAPRCNQGGG